ncbi:MAG: hypothetical protein EXQ50_08930 [Acidobacteria bacterium]|nr:hypothetical protein [Acidobacteriota bacterium]
MVSSIHNRLGRAVLAVATLWSASTALTREPPVATQVYKTAIPPPPNASVSLLAVSPDGGWLAFVAATGGKDQLWVRRFDAQTAQPIAGTDGASFPFWSPGSQFVAYFAGGKLKRVAVGGGPSQTVCDLGTSGGGAWNRDGVIIFTALGYGLYRVSAAGGETTRLMPLDRARLEWNYHSPSFLPDGRHFIYSIQSTNKDGLGVYLGSLDQAVKQRILAGEGSAIYASSGSLLFVRDGALFAQSFDARERVLAGDPVLLAERIGRDKDYPRGSKSASSGWTVKANRWPSRRRRAAGSTPGSRRTRSGSWWTASATTATHATSGCTMWREATRRDSRSIRVTMSSRSGRPTAAESSGRRTAAGRSRSTRRTRAPRVRTSCR